MAVESVKITFCDKNKLCMVPRQGTEHAAGFDIFSPEEFTIMPGDQIRIATNFKLIIPQGWYGQVFSRSGLCAKFNIVAQAGTIDSDYRGEVSIILYRNLSRMDIISTKKDSAEKTGVVIPKGAAIAQIVFLPHFTGKMMEISADVLEEDKTSRGDGGFGSTDKK